MDGQGYSREVAFSQSVINIGADNGNDIVLRGSSVADFHALMHYDSGHWSLSSLNGAYRTSVNGLAMGAEGTVLQNGSIVEIGPYRLTMMLNGINTDIIIQSPAEAGSSPDEDSIGTNENIQLEITRMDQTELDAGAAAEIELTVTNAGPLVANMQLQLQGIPSAWVQIIPPVLNLNEGRKGTFLVRISPPRNSSAAAGLYSIHFVAISPNYPRNTGVADTTLTILPYSEFLLSGPTPLQLKLSRGKQTDIADFVVINNSNAVGAYFVQSRDDSNELNFAYQKTGSGAVAAGQEMITVQAGDRARIPMEITAKKVPLLGMTSKHHHYYTEVTPSDRPGETQTIAGEVVVKPTIHTMVLLLLLALLVLSVAVIFQPYIHTFDLQDGRNSQVIVAGSSTHLRWNVSRFASTITLNNGQADSGVSRGGSEYVNPTSSVTYTLTAENFLSKLLNITHKKTVQVLVVPMRPAIDVFSVDKSRALFDESVTLNWSVEPNATSATITTNKAANQLTAENYTGKLSQGYQTDSLISLKAQNDSGYDVKSLFVNVAEDSITLNKFVVWVRPNGIAVPENNDVRRNTRWGSLQVTGGTANRGTGVNPQPAAQSNTLEIPDNFNTVGYGTQNLNPEVMAVSGQAMPSGSYSYQPPAGSGSPSTELLVSPALNPTATPIPTVDAPSLAADNVIVRATAAPSTSPEGTSSNRDFTIKLAEVIEDPLADSGYRVISYYPDYVLQKQEQILVEWNVDGVSKVKIENLSGDDLTNNGGEYSYPEKSTTYTLTAQVGETKKVYSLPVNVAGEADNGEGSGLNCELKANATTLKVPGTVMLTWSGGGTNRVQLVSSTQAEKENDEAEKKKEEEAKAAGQSYTKPTPGPLSGGTIGDYLQPSGFMRVNVDKQTTFMLNAYDASNNVICTKSVEVKYEGGVDKKDVTLAITRIADSNNVVRGVYTLGQTVFYTVALSGYEKGKDPSGNVMLTDGVTTCSMTLPVTTCSFQAKKLGDLTITAVYAGDDTYNKATATAKERVVEKLPTSIQINSAIKPTSDTADVEVELLWDHNHSYGFVPGGIVTLTAGSSSCDINIDDKSMTCAGEVNVVKVATAEDENQKENKEKGYTAGSVYISVKNLGLKDLTADRVTAVYKGDDYFKTSTSQSVLFMKIPTTIEISEAYKPDKDHANVKTLLSWDENKTGGRLPTGTLKYTVGTGSCTLEIETGKLSCEPKTGTVSKDHHNYTISNMLLEQNGADRISVEYSGDSLFNASTSTQVLFATIPTELEISEAEKTSDGGLNATITLSWDKTAPEGMTPGKTIKLTLSSDNSGKNKSASVTTESTGANSVSDSTTNTDTTETETTGASCTLLITGDEPKFTDCKGEVSVKTTEDKKRIYEIKNLDMGSSKGDTLKAEYSGDGTFISSTSLPVFFNIIDTELTLSHAIKSSDNRISLTAKLTPEKTAESGEKPTGTIVFTSGAATCTLDISDPEKLKFDGCTGNVSVDSDGNYTITNMVMKGTPGASISAEYSGDGVYGKSTSPTVSFGKVDTTMAFDDNSVKKEADNPLLVNFTSMLRWKQSDLTDKNIPATTKPTGTITFKIGTDVEKPVDTCTLDIETLSFSCKGENTDVKKVTSSEELEFTLKKILLSKENTDADRVKAVYSGDAYFNPSESTIDLFKKLDPKLKIVKITDESGVEHQWYAPEQTVIVEASIESGTTGKVKITVDTASCDIELPNKTCELKLAKVTGSRNVVASYDGDSNYNSGTAQKKIEISEPKDLTVVITKITDMNGVEQKNTDGTYEYGMGETVKVYVDLQDFDSKEVPTGKIKITIGDATKEIEYPEGVCELTLPTQKGTYAAVAEYEGNGYYETKKSDEVKINVLSKKINLEITAIKGKIGDEYRDKQPYFVYDPKVTDINKRGQEIMICAYLTKESDTDPDPSGVIIISDLDHKGPDEQPIKYGEINAPGGCIPTAPNEIRVKEYTGTITLTAQYPGDDEHYGSRTAIKTMIVQNRIEPKLEFYAYRTITSGLKNGSILFMFDYDPELPDQYGVSPYVDETTGSTVPQNISFTMDSWTCTYNLKDADKVTETGTSDGLSGNCVSTDSDTVTKIKYYKDYGIFEIENVAFPAIQDSEKIKGSYNGNTYFYSDEMADQDVYREDKGFTRIVLSDPLRIINTTGEKITHAFLTATMSYNQNIKDTGGNIQKPAGKLEVRNSADSVIMECPFDLDATTFECGKVEKSGTRFIFTFENMAVPTADDKVKVRFDSGNNYFEDSNVATADLVNESAPVITLQDAVKISSTKADLRIIVEEMNTLTKKYNVYPYVRIGSKVNEDDPEARRCLFNIATKEFEGTDCTKDGYSEDGDAFILKGVSGIIWENDKYASAALVNTYTSNSFAEADFPKDGIKYSYNQIATTLELTDVLKYNDTHAFMSFNIKYDEAEAAKYGAEPTGLLVFTTQNADGSDHAVCGMCLGDDGCDNDTPCDVQPTFVIDHETGDTHWEIQNYRIPDDFTKVSLEYKGDEIFGDSYSGDLYYIAEKARISIVNAVKTANSIYMTYTFSGLGELTEKYIPNLRIRAESNDGNKTCEYSVSDDKYSSGCSVGEVIEKGNTIIVKNLNGILSEGDTALSLYFASDYLEPSEYPKDRKDYTKFYTSMKVTDVLKVYDQMYLTAELTYNETPRDSYGMEPTGTLSMEPNTIQPATSCSFDLAAETFSCGELSKSGNKVVFTFKNQYVLNNASSVTVTYSGDDFYNQSSDFGNAATESINITVNSAKKTNKNNGYMALTIPELGPLSKKYGVYPQFRITSTSGAGGELYCDFDRSSLQLVSGPCKYDSIQRKASGSNDLIIIKNLSGIVQSDAYKFSAGLRNQGNSFGVGEKQVGRFNVDIQLSDDPQPVRLKNKNSVGYNAFADVVMTYDADGEIAAYYGDLRPTGTITIRGGSSAFAADIGSSGCNSNGWSEECKEWTYSTGQVSLRASSMNLSLSATQFTPEYSGDDIFGPKTGAAKGVTDITAAVSITDNPVKYTTTGGANFTFTAANVPLMIKYKILTHFQIQGFGGSWTSTISVLVSLDDTGKIVFGSAYYGTVMEHTGGDNFKVRGYGSTDSSFFNNYNRVGMVITGDRWRDDAGKPHSAQRKLQQVTYFSASPASVSFGPLTLGGN